MKELDYPYDKNYLQTKRKQIKRTFLTSNEQYTKKRIAILGGSTTANIKDCLELFLLNYGIEATFYESDYNKYYEDAIFSNPELDAFLPEIIYVCTSVRNISQWPRLTDDERSIDQLLNSEVLKLQNIWETLYKRFGCTIIQNNFDMPTYRLMGNYAAVDMHGSVNFIMRLNLLISEKIKQSNYLNLVDLNYISADYGLSNWHDMIAWYSYKYAMNIDAIPDLAYNVANVIKALLGKNKKAFVLDLDNTIWGGVVGEDGADNILMGPEVPLGQAYSDFQSFIKEYTGLGIVLTIDSKNDIENALAGLKHHDSILRKDDFICIEANWDPKDKNIKNISNALSLGPDSFVFVDDNPAERMIVRENIRKIAVPEIQKVTDYIQTIDHSGFFETISISEDDTKRNEMYKENIARTNLESSFECYGDYLKALDMKATIEPFEAVYLSRIAQLTNKSNQFNLTTRRYTPEEIEASSASKDCVTLYGKLEDKFGDNGVVTVVMGHIDNFVCYIDLWLMSCRVLKRDMEYAMMDKLVLECRKRKITAIVGIYKPTAKNSMVKEFYKGMGFTFIEDNDGSTTWKLDLTGEYVQKNKYIKVRGCTNE